MQRLCLDLHAGSIDLHCPQEIGDAVRKAVSVSEISAATSNNWIRVEARDQEQGSYRLSDSSGAVVSRLSRSQLLEQVAESICLIHAALLTGQIALGANLLRLQSEFAIVASPQRLDRNVLSDWCLRQGLAVSGAEQLVVEKDGTVLGSTHSAWVVETTKAVDADRVLSRPSAAQCGLVLIAEHLSEGETEIQLLSANEATLRLLGCVKNASNLAMGGFAEINAIATKLPVLLVRFGAVDQLQGCLDRLIRFIGAHDFDPAELNHFASVIGQPGADNDAGPGKNNFPKPAVTPSRGKKRLTIGMATYDDFDGAYFTLQSLRFHHPEIMDQTEILLIDNNPTGFCSHSLKQFDADIHNLRYIPFDQATGTSASRDMIFEEACGDYVVVMDCHVMLESRALARLDDFFRDHPQCSDLLQGPLILDDLKTMYTQFDPVWEGGMFGRWGEDPRGVNPDGAAFDIPMQGLGLFACRREAWPGFNKRFRGFGGEEGYIHEKFRRDGGRILCLPFLRWIHRFKRPMGVPYPIIWEDRIRNYLIGFEEVGLPIEPVIQHFSDFLSAEVAQSVLKSVEEEKQAALERGEDWPHG